MCNYSGEKDDPQRHNPDDLPDDVVEATTQSLLKEGTMNSNAFGLLPFCKKNPALAVSFQPSGYFLSCYTLFLRITLYNLLQANDNFWKIQYDHEAAKKARAAKRAERKTAKPTTSRKRKPSASELFQLDDSDDNEEEVTF